MTRFPTLLTASCLAVLALSGCSSGPQARFAPPTLYSAEVASRAMALTDSGEVLLKQGRTAEAIRVLGEMKGLVPTSAHGPYALASALARAGKREEAIQELTRALDLGWDNPVALRTDPDLEPLRSDARFPALLSRSASNYIDHLGYLSRGLPEVRPEPGLSNSDSISSWRERQISIVGANMALLSRWQFVDAQINVEAQRIVAQRSVVPRDTSFHESMQRVLVLAGLNGLDEDWGPISAGVLKEAADCLRSHPGSGERDAACYWSGVASFCRRHSGPGDAGWPEAVRTARDWFGKIPTDSRYRGAREAWELAFDLAARGADTSALRSRLPAFAAKYGQDPAAGDVIRTFLYADLIRALWPIPITGRDLDGRSVSLAEFRGKVLLLDFWGTACGPCLHELPGVRRAYARHHSEGLEVLSVSVDDSSSMSPVSFRRWITENQMTWRHVRDGAGWDGPLPRAYHVSAIPAPFLIGRDGSLVAMGEECLGGKLEASLQRALRTGS